MWVDEAYGRRSGQKIAPWRTEEVAANAAVIEKVEQLKGVLLTEDADTTEVCDWLRSQRDTPEQVLGYVATLEQERVIEVTGTAEEKRKWLEKMNRRG
jgi:hypothetical protein